MNSDFRTGRRLHPAWIMMFACILFQGAFLGILYNNTGIVISAIILDRGYSASSFSVYYTIRTLCGALSAPFLTIFMLKSGVRPFLTVTGLVYSISFGLMYFFQQPWQWYLDGAVIGVVSVCTGTAIPYVINNWFKKKNGLVLGITMAASGLAGAAFSPVCSSLISSFGWETTSVIMAVFSGLLCMTGAFLVRQTPSDLGLSPYGAENIYPAAGTFSGSDVASGSAASGSSAAFGSESAEGREAAEEHILHKPLFLALGLTVICLLAGSILLQLTNYFPLYAASVGYDLSVGALMTSCIMIGNVFGKCTIGTVSDHIGPWKADVVMICFVIISFLLLLFGPQIPATMYCASFLFGLSYGVGSVLPSLLCLDTFGRNSYTEKLGLCISATSILGSVYTLVIGLCIDTFHTYRVIFGLSVFICLLSIAGVAFMLLLRKKEGYSRRP